jgi:hypothetical protein
MKNVGLITSSVLCCDCETRMFFCVESNCKDVYRWRFRRIPNASASVSHGSCFQQSNLKFVAVLFLTYIVRSYEHDREHVAPFEGIPQFLQPDRDYIYHLHTTFCGGVPIPQRRPFLQFYRHRGNHGLDRRRSPSSTRSCRYVAFRFPSQNYNPVKARSMNACGARITTDDVSVYLMRLYDL